MKRTGQQPAGGYQELPAGERAIFSWVNDGGAATIDKAHGEAVAKVGTEFTTSIEAENRNRFFRRNLGYVIAGLAMTAAVVAGVIKFGGLQDQDISILVVLGFVGFFFGMFMVPTSCKRYSASAQIRRARAYRHVAGVCRHLRLHRLQCPACDAPQRARASALPALQRFVADYPFPFVLVAAFAALNGLFFYLMRAPTALGRPIMDQLSGFKLYLETAEADRLNMQAPEITADRFEALLPYAVALDVEKPWSDAFAAALRRAHPDDADPMRALSARLEQRRRLVGRRFRQRGFVLGGGRERALASAVPVSSGSSGFGGGGGSGGGGGGGGGEAGRRRTARVTSMSRLARQAPRR